MNIKLTKGQTAIAVVAVLAIVGAITPDDPSAVPVQPVATTPSSSESPLDKRHNGITGQEFIDFCMANAGAQILQNPQTAKHPNLLQRNEPYLSSSNDWAWQSWVEGANLYGVVARVSYVCWRTPNGKVSFEVVK